MGVAVVGRLHKREWNHRETPSVGYARSGFRNDLASGKKTGRRSAATREPGKDAPSIQDGIAGFRGAVLRPTLFPNTETIDAEALPPNSKHSPLTCLWEVSALRHRNRRPPTICVAEIGKRSWVGVCQPPSKSDVEVIRDGKEVELLSGEQSRKWGVASREKPSPRKTRPSGKSDCASLAAAKRARPYDGPLGHIDRDANRGNSGITPKRYKFPFRPDQNRPGVLSRFARFTKDQRQQAYSSLANSTRETALAHIREWGTNKRRRFGISNSKRYTHKRHQLVASAFETCWWKTRDAVADLDRLPRALIYSHLRKMVKIRQSP